MVYITLDELKEILPDILNSWIDDDDDESWEWIFQEIEQKCHIGKKKKDKKKQKKYAEYDIDSFESKFIEHIKDSATVLSTHRKDINELDVKISNLSKRVDELSKQMLDRVDRMERDIKAAKSMAQIAKQRTEVDYTKCADSNGYFTEAQVAQHIYNRMANRGATKVELDSFREVIKKYDATSYSWNKEKMCETCKYMSRGGEFPCTMCNCDFDKWEAKDNG